VSEDSIYIVGGVGGVQARLDDMEYACATLRGAADGVRGVSRLYGMAEDQVYQARAVQTEETAPYVDRAMGALTFMQEGPNSVNGTTFAIEDMELGLRAAAEGYAAAEQAALDAFVNRRDGWTRVRGGVDLQVWSQRHAAAAVVSWLLGRTISMPPLARQGVTEWIRPEGGAPTTGILGLRESAAGVALLKSAHLYLSPLLRMRLPNLFLLTTSAGADMLTAIERLLGEGQAIFAVRRLTLSTDEPPTGFADLARSVANVYPENGGPPQSGVRIETITQADGTVAYNVFIPGTEDWGVSSTNASDTQANLALSAGEDAAILLAVMNAMAAQGIPADAPIQFVGHSQAALVISSLISRPDFLKKYNVTHVVTFGGPLDNFPIPDGIQVVDFGNLQDVVPGTDGVMTTDQANRTTILQDLDPDAIEGGALHGLDMSIAHVMTGYFPAAEAADLSDHPSLLAYKESGAAFLAQPGATSAVTTYEAVTAEQMQAAQGLGNASPSREVPRPDPAGSEAWCKGSTIPGPLNFPTQVPLLGTVMPLCPAGS